MIEYEKTILDNSRQKKINIDPSYKYSDDFYDEYINKFQINTRKRYLYNLVKRLFDIISSFLALILLIVPFIIISIAIKIDSKGPVIFKNRRVGKNGKIFNCLKFRSMRISAPSEVATSIGGVECYITKVGRFLRKTSLDELPQLFNVLIGEMSIIGYRPLVTTEEKCNNMRDKLGVFKMKPGISGFAQIHGRDDVYYKNKALLDAYYVKNASIRMDFSILFYSVKVVLKKEGNNDKTKDNENEKVTQEE